MDAESWTCTACHWQGHIDEIEKEERYKATETDPAEWVWHCPICNREDTLEESITALCIVCGSEPVPDEGETCHECYQEECERQWDEEHGH